MNGAPDLLKRHAAAVDAYLGDCVARHTDAPPRLMEAVRYSVTAGGKRLRPALVLECHHACGGAANDRSALAAAAAIELIHTFSLVHDDLPAMDDDDLRRGKPTNHKVFGEATAILAGDAMVTMAFEILSRDADASVAASLVRELAHAAGPAGMIGGQVLDMAAQNQSIDLPQLQRIHRMKTGALIVCACRMGSITAGQYRGLDAVTEYATHIGMAFQIVDDLLDVTATPEQLGKHTNKDADSGKNTYPRILGLEASRAAAEQHTSSAIDALKDFDARADGLRSLARFITSRQS